MEERYTSDDDGGDKITFLVPAVLNSTQKNKVYLCT